VAVAVGWGREAWAWLVACAVAGYRGGLAALPLPCGTVGFCLFWKPGPGGFERPFWHFCPRVRVSARPQRQAADDGRTGGAVSDFSEEVKCYDPSARCREDTALSFVIKEIAFLVGIKRIMIR
jgi:hypothetical protein